MDRRISLDELRRCCCESMINGGFKEKHAAVTADILSLTDAFGVHSHGTNNIYNYIKKAKAGGVSQTEEYEIVREGREYAVIDAHAVLGQYVSREAMDLAIRKAEDCAITCVTVRNSSHYGSAGAYVLRAAEKGMIGIVCTCGDRNTTVPGGKGPIIGNNPLAYALPANRHHPVFMDIAFSTVAALKVVMAQKAGKEIPETWLADENGIPTTDPFHFPDRGALLPVGMHKGYGLSMMVDCLTSILSGGSMLTDITSWLYDLPTPNKVSHTFLVINVSKFTDPELFRDRIDTYVDYLHNAPKAAGSERILVPGEIEWEKYEDAMKNGVSLPSDVAENIEAMCAAFNVNVCWRK